MLLPVVLLLCGIVAISAATAVTAAGQARRQIDDRLRDVARFLVEESRFPLTADVLRCLRTLSGGEYLLIPHDGPRLTSLPADRPARAGRRAGRRRLAHAGAGGTAAARRSGLPLRRGSPRRGANQGDILYLLYPESWRDARWQAIRPALVLGGGVGLTALLLALAQAQRLHRRVQELERRTRLIAAGQFDPMPLPDRDDEIRDLARSVNEMAARLAAFEQAIQQTERLRLLGQVSGGLAHQLRNGLTGARLAVQLYLHEADPVGDREPLEVALRQLALLETHVRALPRPGRTGPTRRDPTDLVALVGEAVELVRPQCRHAGITLTWVPPAEPCVCRPTRCSWDN
ncbi:MAG: HAMP domain-containing protein [Gemmataceae bacterium]